MEPQLAEKNLPSSDLLLLWPGEVRRKREDDSGRTGLALFAVTNKSELGRFFFADAPLKKAKRKNKVDPFKK